MKEVRSILYFLMLGIFLQFNSCKENDEKLVYRVPNELEPYITSFIQEAKVRGMEIEITNLIMEFSELENEDFCGECLSVANNLKVQRRIRISTISECWSGATTEAKESLLFHELGHCILNRIAHKEQRLPNGDLASLMNRRDKSLYESCVYNIGGGDCDKRYRRQYYLDELFNENTPTPAWGN